MTLFEMISFGPVVAGNEELGLYVTVNGSYFNLWVQRGDNDFENTDCRALSSENGLYSITAAEAIERGERALRDWIRGDDEEE